MNRSFFKSAAIGLSVTLGALAVLVLAGAFIAEKTSDPQKLITPLSYIILAVSAFAGGAAASRFGGGEGPAASAVCGAMISVLHLAVHIILGGEIKVVALILTYAGVISLSFLGGMTFRRRTSVSSSKKLKKMKKLSKISK